MTCPILFLRQKHFISNHTWYQVRELGRMYYNIVVRNTMNLVFVVQSWFMMFFILIVNISFCVLVF